MHADLQTPLQNLRATLVPLQPTHFDSLYALAANPLVWQQHPNKNRWQKTEFETYFDGALQSGGAYLVMDNITNKPAGCTRFYNFDEASNSIFIGYTFYATNYWGTGLNQAVKGLMLDYVFQFVSKVFFHVGACNIRSQKAMQRLGAQMLGEESVAYHGEAAQPNMVYAIYKNDWMK